ncbi:HlyD family secretion protein [Afifella sp. IM 167]|uniref:HlyD family secretion protein n=1 Tax=Afifella sp. IM 167 TaxID=2033586 RepID=UPI001CCC6791|nr:HlyD family efflux transporter periplasmic adaptor subunit [Afifella sp. IM 167]
MGTARFLVAAFLAALTVAGLAGCKPAGEAEGELLQGYVEGDFIYAAPEIAGRIASIDVHEGERVKAGDILFRLETKTLQAQLEQAQAELSAAKAELADRREGQRPPELAVISAQIDKAEATRVQAEREYHRQEELFDRGVIAGARLDQAREALRVAEAQLAEANRQKEVATLPARTAQIEAAERKVEAAGASLDQARTQLGKAVVAAPEAGLVDDVYYEPGEVLSAGAPALSLLPDAKRKIVFFIPEPMLARFARDDEVAVTCDNCPANLSARVTRISAEAEFTPPVIFSQQRREKLLFRAEARPAGEAAELRVGQPVDIRLKGPGGV